MLMEAPKTNSETTEKERAACGVRVTHEMLHGLTEDRRLPKHALNASPLLQHREAAPARQSNEPNVDQASSPLRRVEWLAALLDLSPCRTYDAIASKQVPGDCVVRIGRRLRIIETRVNVWLGLDQFGGQRLQTGT